MGQLQQGLVLAPQRALREVVSPVGLEEPAVGRVVVGGWKGGQGPPEVLSQGQVLWGRVLELGEFHFILQDDQPVSLKQTSAGVTWLSSKELKELQGQPVLTRLSVTVLWNLRRSCPHRALPWMLCM